MKIKSLFKSALALILAFCCAPPAQLAFADEDETPHIKTVEYAYLSNEKAADIPDTIEEKDGTWQLVSTSTPALDPAWTPETKTFTHTEEGTFETIADAQKQIPSVWGIDEDGYKGDIPQTSFEAEEIYATYTTINETQTTYGPYPSNDISQLPAEAQDASPLWTTLTNADGDTIAWNATVTVRTPRTIRYVAGYKVTANYEGTLALDVQRYIVTATYEFTPTPENNTATVLASIAGVAAASAIIAPSVVALRRRSVSIKSLDGTRKLGSARLKVSSGKAALTLPASIDLGNGALLNFKPKYATGLPLTIDQQFRGTIIETTTQETITIPPAAASSQQERSTE